MTKEHGYCLNTLAMEGKILGRCSRSSNLEAANKIYKALRSVSEAHSHLLSIKSSCMYSWTHNLFLEQERQLLTNICRFSILAQKERLCRKYAYAVS